jgi:hypothetical protein
MIDASYPVLALFTGSGQSLSRSLPAVDRIDIERPPATRKCRSLSHRKPPLHPPACQFSRRIRHRKLQKHIQYPETRSGSVQ